MEIPLKTKVYLNQHPLSYFTDARFYAEGEGYGCNGKRSEVGYLHKWDACFMQREEAEVAQGGGVGRGYLPDMECLLLYRERRGCGSTCEGSGVRVFNCMGWLLLYREGRGCDSTMRGSGMGYLAVWDACFYIRKEGCGSIGRGVEWSGGIYLYGMVAFITVPRLIIPQLTKLCIVQVAFSSFQTRNLFASLVFKI